MLQGCVPAEDEFGENTPMAQIQARGFIDIGIPESSRPFAFIDSNTGEPAGFAVELGRYIADELGVEPHFVAAPSADLPEIVGNGFIDVAFPLTPLTQHLFQVESKLEGFEVTTPYFVAHQRLLTRTGARIRQVADLSGKPICQVLDPVAGVDVATLAPDIQIQGATEPSECTGLIRARAVEAVTASDSVLMGIRAELGTRGYQIVGEDLTTEGYPAVTPRGMGAWASRTLNEAEAAGVWAEAYEKWVSELSGEEPSPPLLTLEDAASIYPSED